MTTLKPDPSLCCTGRVAIVGVGSVGATIAHTLMLQGLANELVLIDANRAKCQAEVKDLNHGRRFAPPVRIIAGTLEDCRGAEIVVVTAGAKQKPGQTRLDLAQTNVAIFREMIPAISAAAPDAILLVVSNPVDLLTYAARKWYCGPRGRVIGSGTVLDSSRFVSLLAERLGVAVRNVHGYIIGEHGDSELPLWSSVHIGVIPLEEFRPPDRPPLSEAERAGLFDAVRSAAAEIIAAKGATNWAVGLAVARIVEAIRRDENAVLTVSRLIEDYCGISDVCLSAPCLVNRQGAGPPLPIPMTEAERQALRESAEVLRRAARAAGL